jgi:uncharacterized membrane protein (GlpM family)
MFYIRLIIGGLLVAGIPEVAKHLSTRWAGILMLIPIVTIMGLFFIGSELGMKAAQTTATSVLWGLLPLTVFVGSFILLSHHASIILSLTAAAIAWLSAAFLLTLALQ